MPHLKDLLQQHLAKHDLSARTFAERVDISYPTVLALLHKDSVPRKAEHREILRRELGVDQEAWATVLASSQKDAIDIPASGPLTLQQIVLKALLGQGYTEQSFARMSKIPYAKVMGITRKGSIPRGDTLVTLAEKLGLSIEALTAAAELSRSHKHGDAAEAPVDDANTPSLAQLVADAVAKAGTSVASFARVHDIPYLSLTKLIKNGLPPRRKSVLEPLAKALGLAPADFDSSLRKSKANPTPATARSAEAAMSPLQEALHRVVTEKKLTTKAFAELSDLSVLTATKLLKRGALPGRATTHEKLRALLGIDGEAYQDLLKRSRGGATTPPPGDAGDDDDLPGAGDPGLAGLTDGHGGGPGSGELLELVERLTARQRDALKQFILTMI
jgi:predicted transcriptional regulator